MRGKSGRAANGRRIRTLIADDEPLARELLSRLVLRDPELELLGAVGSGSEALSATEEFGAELLLLDIQMPNLDGISVAEQLTRKDEPPYVIFVTAHDNFALQAFEVAVRDYLVKPIRKRQFRAAIGRAKTAIGGADTVNRTAEALTVRSGETVVSLLPDDIMWVAAANQYVCLHTTSGQEYVVSQSLRQFGRSLSDTPFVRVHRSTMINQNHLSGVICKNGRYRVRLADESEHDIARSRRAIVSDLLARARENAQP